MVSEAQKRASEKYRKNNVKQYILKFYPADRELFDYLSSKENRSQFLKDLIRADMEKQS